MMRPRLLFVVETNTDVRFVEGLSESFDLTVLGRNINGSVQISQKPSCPVNVLMGPASRLSFARFVWQFIRQKGRGYQFILVHEYGAAALATNLASIQVKVPVAMLVGKPAGSYYLCRQKAKMIEYPFRWYEQAAIQAFARANAMVGRHYIVVSEYLGGVVRDLAPSSRIDVIPAYGVDTRYFGPTNLPKEVLKKQLGLPGDGKLIFFSSRIAPEKDVGTLLEAFSLLLRRRNDLWLLNRSGGYKQFLQEATKRGVGHRAIGTDAVHPYRDLPLTYQASDVCVQASREEGLGMSPLEALACGVPVVASAVGGLQETIGGDTGWTYPPGDAVRLADAIEAALGADEEVAARTETGRQLVTEQYSRKRAFTLFENVIREVIANERE